MNTRFKMIRNTAGLGQADFGKSIGVSRDTIANIEGNRIAPKDIHIKSVCREYGVSEEWLRTGSGEPYTARSRAEIISQLVSEVDGLADDSFTSSFITVLAMMNKEQRDLFERTGKMFLEMYDKVKYD